MQTIQHIKYLLASEYVHKTLSLVENSELKGALFEGNAQEKIKPVARLVILFDIFFKVLCVFSHLGSLFLGAKNKKLKAQSRRGEQMLHRQDSQSMTKQEANVSLKSTNYLF